MSNIIKTAMIVLLAILLGYFIYRDVFPKFILSEENYKEYWEIRQWLIPHFLGALAALLIGPIQLTKSIRTNHYQLHRNLGRIYVGSILIASTMAFKLAIESSCQTCIPPLIILSILWFIVTLLAFYFARHGHFEIHQQFMIRSYVLTFAFVIIRTLGPVLDPLEFFQNLDSAEDRRAIREWLTWVIPLLITESWFIWTNQVKR